MGTFTQDPFVNGKYQEQGKWTTHWRRCLRRNFEGGRKMHGQGLYLYRDGSLIRANFANEKWMVQVNWPTSERQSATKAVLWITRNSGMELSGSNDSNMSMRWIAADRMDGIEQMVLSRWEIDVRRFIQQGKQKWQRHIFYRDGNKYEGDFVNGNFQGYGVYLWMTGVITKGTSAGTIRMVSESFIMWMAISIPDNLKMEPTVVAVPYYCKWRQIREEIIRPTYRMAVGHSLNPTRSATKYTIAGRL